MADWSSQPDDGGAGREVGMAEKFGGLCFCLLLAFALLLIIVELSDITIPMP